MKLYSLKTLKNGKFKDVDIETTKSAIIGKWTILTILIIEMIIAVFTMPINTYSDIVTATITLLGYFALTGYCSFYILWYLIACETYIEEEK